LTVRLTSCAPGLGSWMDTGIMPRAPAGKAGRSPTLFLWPSIVSQTCKSRAEADLFLADNPNLYAPDGPRDQALSGTISNSGQVCRLSRKKVFPRASAAQASFN